MQVDLHSFSFIFSPCIDEVLKEYSFLKISELNIIKVLYSTGIFESKKEKIECVKGIVFTQCL